MNESAVNGSEGTDTMLLDKIHFYVHIGLPGGIEPEDIALHRGAELEMPMNEVKRVDVAQHRAEQRSFSARLITSPNRERWIRSLCTS